MSKEQMGLLLTGRYNPDFPADHSLPAIPDKGGQIRCEGTALSLIYNQFEEVIVVGGQKDNRGIPLEVGYAEYLRSLLNDPLFTNGRTDLAERVKVLPRFAQTAETLNDLLSIGYILRAIERERRIVIISNAYHLWPRVSGIIDLIGLKNTGLISVETILKKVYGDNVYTRQLIRYASPLGFLAQQTVLEVGLTGLNSTGFIPGMDEFAPDLLNQMANERRVVQGSIY